MGCVVVVGVGLMVRIGVEGGVVVTLYFDKDLHCWWLHFCWGAEGVCVRLLLVVFDGREGKEIGCGSLSAGVEVVVGWGELRGVVDSAFEIVELVVNPIVVRVIVGAGVVVVVLVVAGVVVDFTRAVVSDLVSTIGSICNCR